MFHASHSAQPPTTRTVLNAPSVTLHVPHARTRPPASHAVDSSFCKDLFASLHAVPDTSTATESVISASRDAMSALVPPTAPSALPTSCYNQMQPASQDASMAVSSMATASAWDVPPPARLAHKPALVPPAPTTGSTLRPVNVSLNALPDTTETEAESAKLVTKLVVYAKDPHPLNALPARQDSSTSKENASLCAHRGPSTIAVTAVNAPQDAPPAQASTTAHHAHKDSSTSSPVSTPLKAAD
jgi:hypothetical protein